MIAAASPRSSRKLLSLLTQLGAASTAKPGIEAALGSDVFDRAIADGRALRPNRAIAAGMEVTAAIVARDEARALR